MLSAVTTFDSSVLGSPAVENRSAMKKGNRPGAARRRTSRQTVETRAEYDFRGGVRGKYAARVAAGTNLVLLDADVAAEFTNDRAVNRALRAYLKARST
jgi:hypothetical protein